MKSLTHIALAVLICVLLGLVVAWGVESRFASIASQRRSLEQFKSAIISDRAFRNVRVTHVFKLFGSITIIAGRVESEEQLNELQRCRDRYGLKDIGIYVNVYPAEREAEELRKPEDKAEAVVEHQE